MLPAVQPDEPLPAAPLARGYELPTARQVVGRGLQLALDASTAIRDASLYVGLLMLAVAGPAAVLLIASLSRLADLPWADLASLTQDQAAAFLTTLGPLYAAGALALLGAIPLLIDGQLIVAALLAARHAGEPLTLREGLTRARQVFWRYGVAAFAVGLLSTIVSTIATLALGQVGVGESVGGTLFATFIATVATAPFGYVLLAVVAGDVGGGTALRRSVTLARARPALAAAVAAFAFLSSTITVLGLGVAVDLVGEVALLFQPQLETNEAVLVVGIPIALVAIVAYGSLSVTVAAIAAAPQVTAFLGLTHYSAGLDLARVRRPTVAEAFPPRPVEPLDETPAEPGPMTGATSAPMRSGWDRPPEPFRPTRWVTIPMLALGGLEVLVAIAGITRLISP
jgi:hypothetical protein